MKNLRFVLIALTAIVIARATEAQETKLRAAVPFDFVVGDRAYPAGEYYLRSITQNDAVIQIANAEAPATVNVSSNECTGVKPSTKTKLVFHRMGNNYFLYQIWIEGNLSGREFPRGRLEVQLAENHLKPEVVIVAAKISH
jgi:hypothetical protein